MRSASRKPLVVTSAVRAPLRSSSALVATVVPILTALMSASGNGSPGSSPMRSRMPCTAASAYASGFSESSLCATSVPSGRRPITSVNVPPRSIQNSQAPFGCIAVRSDSVCSHLLSEDRFAPKLAGARRFSPEPPLEHQPACKPGSVGREAGAPRVTAIPLGRRLPGASSNLPGRPDPDIDPGAFAPRRPYSVLLPVGFAVPPALPPARCALTAPFHPYLFPGGAGGLFSVALSLGLTPAGCYPAPHVHGARTFLPRRLSGLARAAVRPTDA